MTDAKWTPDITKLSVRGNEPVVAFLPELYSSESYPGLPYIIVHRNDFDGRPVALYRDALFAPVSAFERKDLQDSEHDIIYVQAGTKSFLSNIHYARLNCDPDTHVREITLPEQYDE